MIKRGRTKGFTIVELLVVIIVVAILATLVALSYGNAQIQARDTQMRDAADKFSDTIKLMQARLGTFPKGGASSTVVVDPTTKLCADGVGGFQAYNFVATNSSYKCTIGDAAVAMGMLPASFFTNLPINSLAGGTAAYVFMVYQCGTKYYLFYALEQRTSDEKAAYDTAYASCPALTQTALNTYKMMAAEDLTAF